MTLFSNVSLSLLYSAILPVKDVNQQEFVRRLSHYIKKAKIIEKVMDKDGTKLPEWVEYAKTGIHKELPPNHQDWLYVRMGMPFSFLCQQKVFLIVFLIFGFVGCFFDIDSNHRFI